MINRYFPNGVIVYNDKKLNGLYKFVYDTLKYFESNPDDYDSTFHMNIGYDDEYSYELVMALLDSSDFGDDVPRVGAYIGKIEPNSLMADYGYDYVMPYDEDSGDVWDTEITFPNYKYSESDVSWLSDTFLEMVEQSQEENQNEEI